MRAVVQRVKRAEVRVDGEAVGRIDEGLVVLLGVSKEDGPEDADYLAKKVANLRILEDEGGRMNASILDRDKAALVVSQFTLYGDCRKGRRPSFDMAADPESAEELYRTFVQKLREEGVRVEEGVFRAMMEVELVNDGPVTIILDSKKIF